MSCENLIQFDVEAVTSNLTNRYAMLQFISQQNYEEMKQQYSANFPEYFSGSYDQFKLQRNELTKLFIASGYTNLQTSSYRRTLSASSAAAYAACLAEDSNKLIAAWVEAYEKDKILISLRNGRQEDLRYTAVGRRPLNGNGKLARGGTLTLEFQYDPAENFLVGFDAVGEKTGETDNVIVRLEKERHFEIRKTQKELTATLTCGAGGFGSVENNQLWTDAVFVADQDYYLLYHSRKVVHSEAIGNSPGLSSYDLQWIADADVKPRRLVVHPHSMRGNDKHAQGIVQLTLSVIAEREYLVEVVPEQPAAAPALAKAA